MRARFAKHIAILVLVDACASALGWYLTGYAFAFGDNQDAAGFDNGEGLGSSLPQPLRPIGVCLCNICQMTACNYYMALSQMSSR